LESRIHKIPYHFTTIFFFNDFLFQPFSKNKFIIGAFLMYIYTTKETL